MDKMKEVVRALQEKDEHIYSLLDAFPEKIWMATPEGEVDYINRLFLDYSGLLPEEVPGMKWVDLVHPDDVAPNLEKWKLSLSTGSLYEVEQRIRRGADGGFIWHIVRAVPVKSKEGEVLCWLGTSVDIHYQKRVEESLSNFVFIASHDLRSPANNLKSLVSLFKMRPVEEWPRLLSLMEMSTERLHNTLQGMIDMVSIEKKEEKGQHILLDSLFEEVMNDLAQDLKGTGCTIKTDFSACQGIVYVRPYLKSIFYNLIGNAIKYSSPKRRNEIYAYSYIQNEFVVLSISDTGSGIDLDQHREKIFRPFTRLTASKDGKGMGLYLVKSIVEKNGGSIEVESRLDEGTTFRLFLKEYPAT